MHIPVFKIGTARAVEMRDRYGLDGAMIGRAYWKPLALNHKAFFKTRVHMDKPSIQDRVALAKRHLEMSILKGDVIGVLETRRHYTNYFKGIKNFKPYRTAMVTANDP